MFTTQFEDKYALVYYKWPVGFALELSYASMIT